MNDIKATVAKNISELRQKNGMTQLELAEKLNYSDKAVSKWERGESIPDVSVLLSVADLFGVSLDFLVREDHGASLPPELLPPEKREYRREVITVLSVLLVWLIAVAAFVASSIFSPGTAGLWLSFIYAVPVSSVVWLVLNSIWFDARLNYLIISVLMWSVILTLYLTLLVSGSGNWMLYLLGIPGQIIIVCWSVVRKHPSQRKERRAGKSGGKSPEALPDEPEKDASKGL